MSDQYQKLAQFYDDFVQKNRNYDQIATELAELIGDARDILDIGIGTGLVVEHLLQIEPAYKITGIDTSQSLLEQAEKRLGKTVNLHCQNVSELALDKQFDVVYSRGGAWTFVKDQFETMLASHILSLAEIQKSFDRVAKHIKPDGLLIISSSNAYGNNFVELENGIVHKRIAHTEGNEDERYTILDYLFYQNEKLLAEQKLKLRLISYQTTTKMLSQANFVEESIKAETYFIYRKI
ncbi:MAG: class I SAM-dependent methyltransferase [Moorea sp. SIO4E2]|uniref:class I SAM-dependent DNA methyltransferase n=1 Tax=Moorena sp. SIO4E2 TaxID=2607826 RepID=UPI0013B7FEE7|nr:class I SAM-dependent methyltransferase [Moorena sp. SIO4E2]NEQ10956.1 class I SAM-dependent methyltransferase [Moorena sp. SIO4E2]